MITEDQIRDWMKQGEEHARKQIMSTHSPMDQTIDMKLMTLDRIKAEQKDAEE